MIDHLISVVPGSGGFVACRTAEGFTHFSSWHRVHRDRLHAVDVGLDYYDAANEDAHGRLPHQPGYGTPLVLVPDPPAGAEVIPLPVVPRSDAA